VSCGEGGIVGPVVGAMGVLQALEAIKLIVAGVSVADTTRSEFDMSETETAPSPSMTIFSSNSPNPFRCIRLRSRRPDCFACSARAELTVESLTSGSLDYVAFCGEAAPVRILGPDERIQAAEYARLREVGKKEHVLVDVREKVQFDICSIPGSINVPFSSFQSRPLNSFEREIQPEWLPSDVSDGASIYVICRLGNDSQVVAKQLKEVGLDRKGQRYIGDIQGGLKAWRDQVDSSWPDY
jgi:adenylyltransferase and sulfurtransferase